MARWFVLACVCATGCSLALTGPDANRPRNKPPQCDTGKGLVTIDTITGIGLGLTAMGLASTNGGGGAGAVAGLIAAAYFGAALHGNSEVNECRKAMAEYATGGEAPPAEEPPAPMPAVVARMPRLAPAPIQPPAPAPAPAPATAPAPPAPPPPSPPPAAAEPSPWTDFWKELP